MLGKFLPVNSSINIFRWNFNLLNFLIGVTMPLEPLFIFTCFLNILSFCIDLQFFLKDCFHPHILCESQITLSFYLLCLCSLSVFPCFCFSLAVYIFIILHGMLKCNKNFVLNSSQKHLLFINSLKPVRIK